MGMLSTERRTLIQVNILGDRVLLVGLVMGGSFSLRERCTGLSHMGDLLTVRMLHSSWVTGDSP